MNFSNFRSMFFGMVKWLQWVRVSKIVQIHMFDTPARSQRIRWPWNFHWDISQVAGILLHTWHGMWKCFPASQRRLEVKKFKIEKCIFWRVHKSKNSHWAQNECYRNTFFNFHCLTSKRNFEAENHLQMPPQVCHRISATWGILR